MKAPPFRGSARSRATPCTRWSQAVMRHQPQAAQLATPLAAGTLERSTHRHLGSPERDHHQTCERRSCNWFVHDRCWNDMNEVDLGTHSRTVAVSEQSNAAPVVGRVGSGWREHSWVTAGDKKSPLPVTAGLTLSRCEAWSRSCLGKLETLASGLAALIPAAIVLLSAGSCGGEKGGKSNPPTATPAIVGQPCILPDEGQPTFSGYSYREAASSAREPECNGLACIAYHFQGRASCPYGQTEEELSLPPTDPRRCRTPSGEAVTVAVAPQLLNWQARVAVTCSCRCGGTATNASYCQCPAGMECLEAIPDLGLGSPPTGQDMADVYGSYCVWPPPAAAGSSNPGPLCSPDQAETQCGGLTNP
jgi:hypothetical protein